MEEHNSVLSATIEKGALILVTGCNSYLGSAIANQFLIDGYNVRGTVRSLHKIKWLQDHCDKKYGEGRFEAVEVKDMKDEAAFDVAVRGVSGICHTASVTSFSANPDEVIPPTVKGALSILTAATKEHKVKSFVYTSSSAAAVSPKPNVELTVTKGTWNQEAVDQANSNPNPWSVYAASKTEAERAIWKAVEETNPPFQVAAVLPNANFGEILEPGGEMASATATMIVKLYNGDSSLFDDVPPQYFVDVRDTAKLHVAAMVDPACNKERIFAFAEAFNWNRVLGILKKLYPDTSFLDEREDKSEEDLSRILPKDDAEVLLKKHYGHGFTSLEDSIRANTKGLSK